MQSKRTHVSKRDTIYKSCNISYLFIAHLAHNNLNKFNDPTLAEQIA